MMMVYGMRINLADLHAAMACCGRATQLKSRQ
jgi:hypothetical protein